MRMRMRWMLLVRRRWVRGGVRWPGWGMGCRLRGLMRSILGGGLSVQSLWGFGTDVYLVLRGVG